MNPNRTMETAPKDGRIIVVGAPGAGEHLMAWNPATENPLWAPGVTGMWESADRSFTWADYEGGGPEYWRPLENCLLPVPPAQRLGRN